MILVIGIQGRRQEKKVVYMMDVMLEVVVPTFLRPCYQNAEVVFLGFEMFG